MKKILLIMLVIFSVFLTSCGTKDVSQENNIAETTGQTQIENQETKSTENQDVKKDVSEPTKKVSPSVKPSEKAETKEQNSDKSPADNTAKPTEAKINNQGKLYCYLSISCQNILNNKNKFNKDKIDLVPSDGVLYPKQKVEFFEGESVFNVLRRETKKNRIHMEFSTTPVYNSSYIEGIGNIYEFDGGELSGWIYKVNGNVPNYGSSKYILKDNDDIEWVYTLDLGRDITGGETIEKQVQ